MKTIHIRYNGDLYEVFYDEDSLEIFDVVVFGDTQSPGHHLDPAALPLQIKQLIEQAIYG